MSCITRPVIIRFDNTSSTTRTIGAEGFVEITDVLDAVDVVGAGRDDEAVSMVSTTGFSDEVRLTAAIAVFRSLALGLLKGLPVFLIDLLVNQCRASAGFELCVTNLELCVVLLSLPPTATLLSNSIIGADSVEGKKGISKENAEPLADVCTSRIPPCASTMTLNGCNEIGAVLQDLVC
jgi:hypothetical protein